MLWVFISSALTRKHVVGIHQKCLGEKTYVVGTHQKRLAKVLLMITQNICSQGDIKKYQEFLAEKKGPLLGHMFSVAILTSWTVFWQS